MKGINKMNLEQQVCSLELAKKLKELGVKQESIFWWDLDGETVTHSQEFDEMPYITGVDPRDRRRRVFVKNANRFISAFTVAELGEMLLEKYGTVRMFGKFRGFHVRDGSEDGEFIADTGTDANTEADARAKMLIYLLENKVITLSN